MDKMENPEMEDVGSGKEFNFSKIAYTSVGTYTLRIKHVFIYVLVSWCLNFRNKYMYGYRKTHAS